MDVDSTSPIRDALTKRLEINEKDITSGFGLKGRVVLLGTLRHMPMFGFYGTAKNLAYTGLPTKSREESLNHFVSAITFPVAAVILTIRVVMGIIIHPSIFFKQRLEAISKTLPPLSTPEEDIHHQEMWNQLADYAEKSGCQGDLVLSLKEGQSHIKHKLGYYDYTRAKSYHDEIYRLLQEILKGFASTDLHADKKAKLLALLSSDRSVASGFYACAPVFINILHEINNSINYPSDYSQMTSHLMSLYKKTIIEQMVANAISAFNAKGKDEQKLPDWQQAIVGKRGISLVLESHRPVSIIKLIGREIGLPKDVIDLADNDPYAANIDPAAKAALLRQFYASCSPEGFLNFFRSRVNESAGELGTPSFRKQISEQLYKELSALTDEEINFRIKKLVKETLERELKAKLEKQGDSEALMGPIIITEKEIKERMEKEMKGVGDPIFYLVSHMLFLNPDPQDSTFNLNDFTLAALAIEVLDELAKGRETASKMHTHSE